jgi:hypothetical protein
LAGIPLDERVEIAKAEIPNLKLTTRQLRKHFEKKQIKRKFIKLKKICWETRRRREGIAVLKDETALYESFGEKDCLCGQGPLHKS